MNNKDDCTVVYEYIPILYILFYLFWREKVISNFFIKGHWVMDQMWDFLKN
jgi:hypothetical protein